MTSSEGRHDDDSHSSIGRRTSAEHVAAALRYVANRRWNAAQAALLRAWECAKHDSDVPGRAACCRLLTEFHRVVGDTGSARQFLQLALDAEASAWQAEDCGFSPEVLVAAAREHVANHDQDDAFRLFAAAACREDHAASLAVSTQVDDGLGNMIRLRRSARRSGSN